MPESTSVAWLLGAALLSSVAGMGWLALAMQVHARQVWGVAPAPGTARVLRVLGADVRWGARPAWLAALGILLVLLAIRVGVLAEAACQPH